MTGPKNSAWSVEPDGGLATSYLVTDKLQEGRGVSYTIGQIGRWDTTALTAAGDAIATRRATAEGLRTSLADGRDTLAEGWSGVTANAVLDAAETEKSHVTKLVGGLEDLTDALTRAEAALQPAVQSVRDRVRDAVRAGLVVGQDSVGPGPGRDDITQDTVNAHAETIRMALDTVQSLDEHYGREIDLVATRLHDAIPPEVDRRPIPGGSRNGWFGAVDAVTGAAGYGFPIAADELDPETRGKHKLNPVADAPGKAWAGVLRGLGRAAGPAGAAVTIYDGVEGYARGETSATEASLETVSALAGGATSGAALGAMTGGAVGPLGAILGAGVGAAVGSYLGKKGGSAVFDRYFTP